MDSILDNYTPATSKVSETTCEICNENPSKYRCPGCELATCSLACSQQHKQRYHCSGKRQKTSFVSRTTFDEAHLSSDIGFLEETARCTLLARNHMRSVDPMGRKGVLVEQANHRQVDLRLLAVWFPKRQENRSFFRGNNMFWTIKWILHSSDEEPLELLVHGAKEQKLIGDLFSNLPNDAGLGKDQKEQLTRLIAKHAVRDFAFFLQLDPAHRHRTSLSVSLTPTMRLGACLARKLIVEYPTIVVRLKPVAQPEETVNVEVPTMEIAAAEQ